MDILSPAYQPTTGLVVTRPAPAAPILGDEIDAADSRIADRADAVIAIRAAILEVQRELHDLNLDLADDDYEVHIDAMFRLTDAADRLRGLRMRLEVTL